MMGRVARLPGQAAGGRATGPGMSPPPTHPTLPHSQTCPHPALPLPLPPPNPPAPQSGRPWRQERARVVHRGRGGSVYPRPLLFRAGVRQAGRAAVCPFHDHGVGGGNRARAPGTGRCFLGHHRRIGPPVLWPGQPRCGVAFWSWCGWPRGSESLPMQPAGPPGGPPADPPSPPSGIRAAVEATDPDHVNADYWNARLQRGG